MDDIEYYRCHHFYPKQSDKRSKQSVAACIKIAGIVRFILATPVDVHRIHLIYSLDQFSFELIIELLEELGFECENLDIDRFDQISPKNLKNPHPSPDKYWGDYH